MTEDENEGEVRRRERKSREKKSFHFVKVFSCYYFNFIHDVKFLLTK